MKSQGSLLVFRFSAMGDVAMSASVLKEFSEQHPDLNIVFVSRSLFKPFFEDIKNIQFHNLEPDTTHKGLKGLYALYQELSKYNPFAIADLHNNLRSNTLSFYFRLFKHIPNAKINKGRDEKKALTRKKNKVLKPLRSTPERYADVFRKLGFSLKLSHKLRKQDRLIPNGFQQLIKVNRKKIGIAPFAKHPFKVWETDNWTKIFQSLSPDSYQFIIFGGGNQEKQVAEGWEKEFPHVASAIGKIKLTEELDIISHLDTMISMDSSGMHMASLVGTRCLSIWGATHPYAGFLGYGQSLVDCIQVEHPNRPSCVYGNKSCICNGIEAINLVTIEMVIDKIEL